MFLDPKNRNKGIKKKERRYQKQERGHKKRNDGTKNRNKDTFATTALLQNRRFVLSRQIAATGRYGDTFKGVTLSRRWLIDVYYSQNPSIAY